MFWENYKKPKFKENNFIYITNIIYLLFSNQWRKVGKRSGLNSAEGSRNFALRICFKHFNKYMYIFMILLVFSNYFMEFADIPFLFAQKASGANDLRL